MLAKNRDLELGHERGTSVLVDGRIDHSFLGLGFEHAPGMITQGVNEMGVCLAFMFVKITKPGWEEDWTPTPGASAAQREGGVLCGELLGRGSSVKEVLEYLLDQTGRGRSLGGTMLLADPEGAVIVEGTDDELAIRRVTSGVEVRNNHFLLLSALGPDFDAYRSSYARGQRGLELLAAHPIISPETLALVLQDHAPAPSEYSICRHATDEDPLSHRTAASTIMIPRNQDGVPELRLARGHPCAVPYETHLAL
jgi:hypothetical protein